MLEAQRQLLYDRFDQYVKEHNQTQTNITIEEQAK